MVWWFNQLNWIENVILGYARNYFYGFEVILESESKDKLIILRIYLKSRILMCLPLEKII